MSDNSQRRTIVVAIILLTVTAVAAVAAVAVAAWFYRPVHHVAKTSPVGVTKQMRHSIFQTPANAK